MPDSYVNDLTLPEVVASARAGQRSLLAATVLYHPDVKRIGERALLGPRAADLTASLSRLEPVFVSVGEPGSGDGPLKDAYLSRAPVALKGSAAGLTIRSCAGKRALKINGRRLEGDTSLPWSDVDAGIVLSLAHRVVLLLHSFSCQEDGDIGSSLVGDSCALRGVRRLIEAVSDSEAAVLLLGESGTGKELVAAAIHRHSQRSEGPFIAVNMAALPPDLAAAELFGVQRGAFTGADRDRRGYFQQAEGGTLFLDEIGACDRSVQPQLLRALQQGEIQLPGGGTRRVDVRVIAATDADLENAELHFSAALRHRLAGFEIRLPPLRERREDLGRLLKHFLPAEIFDATADHAVEVSRWTDLVEKMALYDWPGNIRELSNCCTQLAIASADRGGIVVPDGLFRVLSRVRPAATTGKPGASPPSDGRIREAMLAARWEVARAARALQISRQALYRRLASIPELRVAGDIPGPEIETVYHECSGDIDEAAMRLQVSRAALSRRWRAMDLLPGSH